MQTRWRHPSARSSTRSFSLLPLVLALAALALLPVGARAESSNEKVYKIPIPKVEGTTPEKGGDSATPPKTRPKPQSTPGGQGETNTMPGERTRAETAPEPEGESKSGHHDGAAPGGKGGDHHGGGGKPEGGASPNESQRPESDGTGPTEPGTGVDTGGGSSPVLPILIAIVILAAISIGVVVYRERSRAGDPDSYNPGPG